MTSFDTQWERFKRSVGNSFVNSLAKQAPVDTGFLKGNISYSVKGDVIIFSMPEYAMHVEYGTKPHVIEPKNKKALAFAKAGGRRVQHQDGKVSTEFKFGGKTVMDDAVIVKRVFHPGTTPNPFIKRAIRRDAKNIILTAARRHLS